MDLATVMDQLGAAAETIDGLRSHPYYFPRVVPPAAVVAWPESYDFDSTMGRGSDQVVIPVTVIVGLADSRSARDQLAAYCHGSGPSSVKRAVESYLPIPAATWDSVRVRDVEFGAVTIAAVSYLAATFSIEVTGKGA